MTPQTLEPIATEVAPPTSYEIRRFQPRDAAGITDCVRQVYGDSYVHPELYDPEAIVRLNASGELVSVVALDNEQVVGHYALERPGCSQVAETGEALVLPEHRHHALMEQMRLLIEEEAVRLDLQGLYGNVVTNHPFTQRVVQRFGEQPCAVSLGWAPKSFHNLATPLTQRMSELVYFKYLRKPSQPAVYLPEQHFEWCLKIYLQLQVRVQPREAQVTFGGGKLLVEYRPELQRAMLRVVSVGDDSAADIQRAMRVLRCANVEVVFLELPLSQSGTPYLCRELERQGFFFSGIGPCFASDGDVLRLQWLNTEVDTSLLQLESPLARELLGYVADERRRVTR